MSMDERPDLDTLADYLEGLLGEDERDEVKRWIERDAPTADLVRELQGLPALLAADPVGSMPIDVAARLDAALAAEARHADEQVAPVTELPVQRRRRWLAPALVAAAAVGVIGIGAQVVGSSTSGSDAGGSADTAADAPMAAAGDAGDEEVEQESTPPPEAEESSQHGGGRGHDSLEDVAPAASVSAQTFQQDVTRVVRARRLSVQRNDGYLSRDWSSSSTYSIVDDDCGADLGRGRLAAIRLDGEPALLVLRRVPGQPRRREAAAYPAQCPPALVNSDDMTLPALVRATITLP